MFLVKKELVKRERERERELGLQFFCVEKENIICSGDNLVGVFTLQESF